MVGRTISHYKILDKIGEGGMGLVFKAEDTRLHRIVALKVLHPEASESDELRARLSKEAEIAAALDHPNITTVYEIDESDGRTFLAMPLVEGETLAAKIKRRPLPLGEALEIASQVAEALRAAHAKEVVHRDIKPGNIMITPEGRVKVMDFGLAHLAGQTHITRTGTVMGTPAYMSPEQARAEGADSRSDIWALGAVIYDMLTGRPPFQGENMQSVLYSIINEEHEPITALRVGIPADMDRIVGKAMAKDPRDRYQHAADLMVDLRLLGKVPKAQPMQTPGSQGSRRGALMWIAAILLLILAVGLGANASRLWERFAGGGSDKIDSIAVLALQNLSGDQEQDYFAAGMTEALFTHLGKVGALKVLSPRSARRYEGTNTPLRQIAAELGVKALVQGSAVRIGDRVRITAQLIDAVTEVNLWSESYEREFRDVLVLQGELARAIAQRVQAQLTPDEALRLSSTGPVNTQAYEAYLKGMSNWHKLTPGGLDSAQKYFELALEQDPNYAQAYAGLALTWGGRQQMGIMPFSETAPPALAAAEKALALDNSLPEVHYMVAVSSTWWRWDWEAAEAAYRRTIELNPSLPEVRAYYAHFLMIMNRPGEGLQQMERALELDPFNHLYQGLNGMVLNLARRYDDAITQLEETLEAAPGDPIALSTLRVSYHHKGMFEEAYRLWKLGYETRGDAEALEALERGYREGGYQTGMLRVAEAMIERLKTRFVPAWQIATLYCRAGDYEEAIGWFEKAYEEHDSNMPYIGADPLFDGLREMPRYQAILWKMGLP